MPSTEPVGRLAPSPTGRLHVGHARTFLLAWWHTRSRGGRVVLRIEDLDAPRVVPGAVDGILRDLEWLGLDWDGPVIVQSARLDVINAAAHELVDGGRAYPCVCTRADFQTAASAPHDGITEPRYPGTCRGKFTTVAEAERKSGKPAGLRFRVPEGRVNFVDGFAGPQSSSVADDIGDFLIARKGGLPAYQLAVVIDDATDRVTEVVRGDDLLPSTARQKVLQEALGLPSPEWWHVPLVGDESGRRLAKRADDVSLSELRTRGVDPRAIVAWAARVSNIVSVPRTTAAEVARVFSFDCVSREPVTVPNATDEFTKLLDVPR
jgi:glutamyl-tRNA synthetase